MLLTNAVINTLVLLTNAVINTLVLLTNAVINTLVLLTNAVINTLVLLTNAVINTLVLLTNAVINTLVLLTNAVINTLVLLTDDVNLCNPLLHCYCIITQAFGEAYNLIDVPDSKEDQRHPFIIQNQLGVDVTVDLNNFFTVSMCCV